MASVQEVADALVAAGGPRPASRPLAAFLARMAAYRAGAQSLDAAVLDASAVDALAAYLASEGAATATTRMQATFDAAYYDANSSLDKRRRARTRKMQELAEAACGVAASDAGDVSKLGGLYRALLDFAVAFASVDPAAAGMEPPAAASAAIVFTDAVQREMAAAPESVFPRVGLKQFACAPAADKVAQLEEVGRLVLGIRVFNWDIGRGGLGVTNTPAKALKEAQAMLAELDAARVACAEACQRYADTLYSIQGDGITVAPAAYASWPAELANRRQLATYLSSLCEELRAYAGGVEATIASLQGELGELKRSVGAKTTVAKEAVYPRFHVIAELWVKAAEARDAIAAVAAAKAALQPFIPATVCTLDGETVRQARAALASGAAAAVAPAAPSESEPPGDDVPVRLSLDNSPEFLELPLEYQGYCPVTLATPVDPSLAGATAASGDTAMGILQAGDPSLGVIKYRGRYVVCASEAAVDAFIASPAYYTARVSSLAATHVELVHLLQLVTAREEGGYPEASLVTLIQYDGDLASAAAAAATAAAGAGGVAVTSAAAEAAMARAGARLSKNGRKLVDASTETPVHFVERHIDPAYEWNEWALRRRAVQIANLRKAATTSAQTDASHFRRDNDAQVYLPRESGTQTVTSTAANTTRVVRYVAGLRGGPEAAVAAAAAAVAEGRPLGTALAAAASAAGGSGKDATKLAGGGMHVISLELNP